ncbi:hypothetical protein BG015_001386 [Linnemannia schmuckeri]|uniref:Uncharacterized protein n=1 Tax=Linnemannia schmuckeri TaxID=64567 RepID=A0A9P5VE05_9FUNG|nr:hypothetical protein BG015_001386 [Linnemannia schmuckeri]
MKFFSFTSAIALGLIAAATTEAALSAGCNTYLNSLAAPNRPLAKCRVYTALGFPAITGAHDHDTAKLEKILTTYCATPACTTDQYTGVYNDLQTNCGADMVPENQETLGTVLYMWYLSPAQREAVCYQDTTKNTHCVITSMNEMIERGQLPDANINEDDLYGYLQYVTPLANPTNITATSFCTSCNQQVANIFANYYNKVPAPFSLQFTQNLTSAFLNTVLSDQYRGQCGVTTLGSPIATGNDTPGAFQPTNVTEAASVKPLGLDNGAVVGGQSVGLGSLTGALAIVVSVIALL